MRKKCLSWIFTALVLLMSMVLTVGILVAGPAEAGANEVLTKAPQLTDKDGKLNDRVLNDTANWVNDHFFGRQELISAHNQVVSTVFHVSAADDVIFGNDGWLYYAPTLSDYTGTENLSHTEIQRIAGNLALMQEYCESQGKSFAFMLAPNKNSLYPENMPNYGVCNPSGNAKLLMDELNARGIKHIDLFAAFEAQEEVLYFAHDSHWNSKGAALGADCINEAFGVESNYFGADFSKTETHQGDLFEMLYPAFNDSETNPVYGGELDFAYASKATKPDSITLLTESNKGSSLLCYRDSFGNLLYPYLADSYGACRFSRSVSYDLTEEGDQVLIELVERNISYLYTNLPVMPAPQRELDLPETSGTVQLECKSIKAPEGMFKVTGTLPVAPDGAEPVYVICDGVAYEAFGLQNGGIGAYVPAEADSVAFYHAGALQLYTVQ